MGHLAAAPPPNCFYYNGSPLFRQSFFHQKPAVRPFSAKADSAKRPAENQLLSAGRPRWLLKTILFLRLTSGTLKILFQPPFPISGKLFFEKRVALSAKPHRTRRREHLIIAAELFGGVERRQI